jgi:hypothetical protein
MRNLNTTIMATEQLPEELLQQIMWGLKLDVYSNTSADDKLATRKTLLSCMLANSTLHRLAEPVLYHTISQHELTRLVQCFIRRPKLAGLVRELRDCETSCHDPLVPGLNDIDAWREDNIDVCELWGRPYEIVAIGFVLLMCTRLKTLVLEKDACDVTFPDGEFFEECSALYQKSRTQSGTPLAALRTLVMQPGSSYQFSMNEYDDKWFAGLVFLPNIERIEIAELGMHSFEVSPSAGISNLKSLSIGSSTTEDYGYTGSLALSLVLERLLVKCPSLQHLDVTFHSDSNEGDDNWGTLCNMLNSQGSSLRILHLRNPYEVIMPAVDSGPISLAAMTNLRTLTLPGDAILPSQYSTSRDSTSIFGYNITTLGREDATSQSNSTSRDVKDQNTCTEGSEEGLDPAEVPLTEILPPNLTQLDIVDRTTLPRNVARLEWDLRKVMSSPRFEQLESIQVWRVRQPNRLVVEIDWEARRENGCWKVFGDV